MITVLAEKPDVGIRIAAALGGIRTSDGVISFEQLNSRKREIRRETEKGYLDTVFEGGPCRVTWGFGHLCRLKEAYEYDPAYRNWRSLPSPFIPGSYEIIPGGKKAAGQLRLIRRLFSESDQIINATDYDREGEVIFSYIYQYTKCTRPVKRACCSSLTEQGLKKAFSELRDGAEMKFTDLAGRMRGIADWIVGINLTVAMSLKNPGNGVLSVGRVQTPTLRMVTDRELEIRNFRPEPYWTISAVFTTARGETYKGAHAAGRFRDKESLEREMARLGENAERATVKGIRKETVKKWMPHLYSLSTLQMGANSRYGMTLKQTLDAAQSLYSKGLTTYPRTTSCYLTEDMLPSVRKVLAILARDPEYAPLIGDRTLSGKSRYWFDNSKVESHFAIVPTGAKPGKLSPAEERIYDMICRSVIRMLYGPAELEETKVETDVSGSLFRSSGTVVLDPGWMAVDGVPSRYAPLPSLTEGESVKGAFSCAEEMTKPPERYTDRTLLAAMISAGKLLDDAELRAVLEDPERAGIGTSATRDSIIETLIRREYIVREKKTLRATQKGIDLISSFPVETVKSPEMTAVWEKRLNGIAAGSENAEVFRRDIERELVNWCGTIRSSPSGSIRPEEKEALLCPACKRELKKKPWGYVCPAAGGGCGFSIGKTAKKQLADNQIRTLLTKGRTGVLSGFVSKNGKRFRAALKWDPESSRVAFVFEENRRNGKEKKR